MIDTPEVVQTTAQPAAVIHVTVPRAAIRDVMGPAREELMAVLAAQGIAATGAWFSHHLKMDPDVFDFEVGVPVVVPVAAAGRVAPGELPAARAARTVYHGDFEGLGAAWGEFRDWVAAAGHEPAPDLWECYLAGPETSPDPAEWSTELTQPLLG